MSKVCSQFRSKAAEVDVDQWLLEPASDIFGLPIQSRCCSPRASKSSDPISKPTCWHWQTLQKSPCRRSTLEILVRGFWLDIITSSMLWRCIAWRSRCSKPRFVALVSEHGVLSLNLKMVLPVQGSEDCCLDPVVQLYRTASVLPSCSSISTTQTCRRRWGGTGHSESYGSKSWHRGSTWCLIQAPGVISQWSFIGIPPNRTARPGTRPGTDRCLPNRLAYGSPSQLPTRPGAFQLLPMVWAPGWKFSASSTMVWPWAWNPWSICPCSGPWLAGYSKEMAVATARRAVTTALQIVPILEGRCWTWKSGGTAGTGCSCPTYPDLLPYLRNSGWVHRAGKGRTRSCLVIRSSSIMSCCSNMVSHVLGANPMPTILLILRKVGRKRVPIIRSTNRLQRISHSGGTFVEFIGWAFDWKILHFRVRCRPQLFRWQLFPKM